MAASGIVAYAAHSKTPPHPSSHSYIPARQVIQDIQKQQLQQNKVAQHIQMIHMANTQGEGFAFAAFNAGGNPYYASLVVSSTGYNMGTFSMRANKATPIQYVTLLGDGFEFITGGVRSSPSVKSAVMIFSNGTAVSVPVQNGYFWYEHKVQKPTDAYVKQVIGITNTGEMIRNQTTKAK